MKLKPGQAKYFPSVYTGTNFINLKVYSHVLLSYFEINIFARNLETEQRFIRDTFILVCGLPLVSKVDHPFIKLQMIIT